MQFCGPGCRKALFFRQDDKAVKKSLDSVNALGWECAAYPNVRKQSQSKEFAEYQPLSTDEPRKIQFCGVHSLYYR